MGSQTENNAQKTNAAQYLSLTDWPVGVVKMQVSLKCVQSVMLSVL